MRLHHLQHFLAVIEAGTLRGAARRLALTQPAITKSLRQLEEHAGARLLLRTPRGVVPTPAGRRFMTRAKVIQAELRRMEEELAAERGDARGSVAFGIAPPFSLAMPDALARFRARYPTARVRVIEGVRAALLPLVRDETLDFAMGQHADTASHSGLRFRPVVRPRLVVAGRKGHPLGNARSLAELAGCEWLIFNPLGAGGMLEEAFVAAGVPVPRAIVYCESFATALALLGRSDVLGLMLERFLDDPFAVRFMQRFELRDPIPSPSLGLFQRADSSLTPAAAAMAQAVTLAARTAATS
ncbi:MAG TPA: LysR substrate-binding domain-containing protein [Burkholderiales bacterium]|nr:LysR substrate-binding domain-containing protein [Burkholderiales bacterium]